MASETPFHFVRFLLSATRDIEIPGQQGAMLYALLCNANQQHGAMPAFPQDLMLDAPEQTRTQIKKGDPFAFGGTLLESCSVQATETIERLTMELQEIGRTGKARRKGLGGNFKVEAVENLSDGDQEIHGQLQSVSMAHINRELESVMAMPSLTLRFQSPMRINRPRKQRRTSHAFLDDRYFDAAYLVRRIVHRMSLVGIQPVYKSTTNGRFNDDSVELLSNRLVWIDMSYGGRKGKVIGGLVGRLTLKVTDPVSIAAIVWGQYCRVGKNTAFGFGRYRIEELGPDPFPCKRAVPLLETAWQHPEADRLVMQSALEPGQLSTAIDRIRSGSYQPDPLNRLTIGDPPKQRQLQIPSRLDRVLQRLVLEAIGPGVDQLFESSSFAWRRGLGRHSCARAIKKAYGAGYRYAINADFDQFFDSIDRSILWDKVDAYLNDDHALQLLKLWATERVTSGGNGSANSKTGIPTGSPLSPLLANMLLDRFDEVIRAAGGRLVRYGDDFLILFRDLEQADQLQAQMLRQAKQLQLRLNEASFPVAELGEPFSFLGFDFKKQDKWTFDSDKQPLRLEELGWHDASRKKVNTPLEVLLPGESAAGTQQVGFTAIVGPEASHLEIAGNTIECHYSGGKRSGKIPLQDLETLVVLGSIGINSTVLQRLAKESVNLVFGDDRGRPFGEFLGPSELQFETVQAQVFAAGDSDRCLDYGKTLIRAKITNYAVLAASLADLKTGKKARKLDAAHRRMIGVLKKIDSVTHTQELLGVEGHAARIWYESLPSALGKGFTFEKRVSPNATDPVNVLLNIAYTLLYRLSILTVRSAGMCSSIGLLHVPSQRFQALASDLQESYRFLADRAVIEATHMLRPGDFSRSRDGQYAVSIKPTAVRYFQQHLWETLHRNVAISNRDAAVSWMVMMGRQSRSLRRSLADKGYGFVATTVSMELKNGESEVVSSKLLPPVVEIIQEDSDG